MIPSFLTAAAQTVKDGKLEMIKMYTYFSWDPVPLGKIHRRTVEQKLALCYVYVKHRGWHLTSKLLNERIIFIMCISMGASAQGVHRVLDLLELELWAGLSCLMRVLGIKLRSSIRAVCTFKH